MSNSKYQQTLEAISSIFHKFRVSHQRKADSGKLYSFKWMPLSSDALMRGSLKQALQQALQQAMK